MEETKIITLGQVPRKWRKKLPSQTFQKEEEGPCGGGNRVVQKRNRQDMEPADTINSRNRGSLA